MRIRFYPGERFLFRFEKAIDDYGVAFSGSSHASFRSFGEIEAGRADASECVVYCARKWPTGLRIRTAFRALACGSPIDHACAGQRFARLQFIRHEFCSKERLLFCSVLRQTPSMEAENRLHLAV
jgi:hypothetical protein